MSFEFIGKLPTPAEVKEMYPVTERVRKIKEEKDAMIRKVFTGESEKFLVIIGPCSADNEEAVCDYIGRLRGLRGRGIKECFISRIRKRSRTCLPG